MRHFPIMGTLYHRGMVRSWICLCLALPAFAGEFTLEQALESALKKNRDLRAAEIALENSGYGVEAAAARFQWALRPDGSAGAGDSGETARLGLSAQKNLVSGTGLSAGPQVTSLSGDGFDAQRTAALRVQVEQPLFRRFGELANRESLTRAERSVVTARRDLELRRNDLVVQVVAGHEGLLQLQQQEVYDQQSFERLDRLYRLTAAREKQGRAARGDTLRAGLQRGRAASSLQTTREQLESRRRDHGDLLGLAPTTDLVAVAGARIDLEPPAPEAAASVAWSNRLDLAQVLQDLGDAERGVKIAKRNLLPDVSLVARYDWLGQGRSYGDAMNLDEDAWFVGLAAGNTDLLQTGERAALKQAQTGRLSTELRVEVVRLAVERQALNEITAYKRARQQVVTEEKNHALALDRAKLARRLFEMDRGDNFTVSDAESELQQAESSALAAKAEANIAAYRVLRALGTLLETPEDLKPRPR